jgi:hypothetical protein
MAVAVAHATDVALGKRVVLGFDADVSPTARSGRSRDWQGPAL